MSLEKIIKLTKNVTLSLPLVFTLSCNPSHNEHYYPPNHFPENSNTTQNDPDTTIPTIPTIPLPTPPPATPSPTPTPIPTSQPTNSPPIFWTTTLPNALQNNFYQEIILAIDYDKDILIYELIQKHSWLSIDKASGRLTGTPDNSHVGINDLEVKVSDGKVEIVKEFSINVTSKGLILVKDSYTKQWLIDAKYNIHAQVQDRNNNYYDFKRLSEGATVIFPENSKWAYLGATFQESMLISRMVITIKDSFEDYHLFWFRDIERVEKQGETTIVYFKDGQTFQGEWVSNSDPDSFNTVGSSCITGTVDVQEVDVPKQAYVNDIRSIVFDVSNSFAEFQKSYDKMLRNFYSPKNVELVDGTILSTDLGYVFDAGVGTGKDYLWHEKLIDFCELLEPNGLIREVPLWKIQDIELTGNFDANFPQCRKAIITYKNGTRESSLLNLISEFDFNTNSWNHSPKFRERDMLVVHTDTGAKFIRLDHVKRIIPRNTTGGPQYIEDLINNSNLVIDAKYLVTAQVQDKNYNNYDLKQFSLDISPILPRTNFTGNNTNTLNNISRMVVTIKDNDGYYNLFWFKEIQSVEKQGKTTTVYLRNGQIFNGIWMSNFKPIEFYGHPINGASGVIDEGGIDAFKMISIKDISFINLIDNAASRAEFDKNYSSLFKDVKFSKKIELVDGTILSTDLGYIIDCCGHWWSSTWHERLMSECKLIDQNEKVISVSLDDILEIELTGNVLQLPCQVTQYNPLGKYDTQCREVILRYKNGITEQSYLYLTFESNGGVCDTSSTYKDKDMLIVHKSNGAMLIPLDKVRKIIPLK